MLHYVLACARDAGFDRIHVVHGPNGSQIAEQNSQEDCNWVLQSEPLGTGHAVAQASPHLKSDSVVCVLYGDNPFVHPQTVRKLVELASKGNLVLLTVELEDPTGYGRIQRSESGNLEKIVEEINASEQERTITEVNAGPLAAPAHLLTGWLQRLDNDNIQNEYYLTDIVQLALSDGIEISIVQPLEVCEASGVNRRVEQAQLERIFQLKNANELMRAGVEIVDPVRFDLRGECQAGRDCHIDVNVVLEGKIVLKDDVRIEANNVIRDSVLGTGVTIHPNCVIEGAEIQAGCVIGPFARIRPGTVVGKNCKIGNFVELNRSTLGEGTKVSHLAYIGDAEVGNYVNVGAGAITCNYDGAQKHRTKIGNRVFVGSNASLVAPVDIGDGAVVGAGSTITKDVEPYSVAVARSKVKTVPANRVRPKAGRSDSDS